MNISHQLFDYKITFVNSKLENTNSKGVLYSKTCLNCLFQRFMIFKKIKSKITIVYQKVLIRIVHTSFFYYNITFVNSQHDNTNPKGDFVLKNQF